MRLGCTRRKSNGPSRSIYYVAPHTVASPIDSKPSVCWQLPIKVDWEPGPQDAETATVRRWTRGDWGAEGETMAWCCTEGSLAYVGDRPVIDSLGAELEAIVGTEVYVELRHRIAGQ
jgi:hypothetical protein